MYFKYLIAISFYLLFKDYFIYCKLDVVADPDLELTLGPSPRFRTEMHR